MNEKTRNIISLIMNIAMVVLVIYAIGWFFSPAGSEIGVGNMDTGGTQCLKFFTNQSNILAAISCAVLIPYNIKAIKSGTDAITPRATLFKFVGTTAVTLTFVVVVLFLGPIMGYDTMFENACLELHLICPLLAIVSFCYFERGYTIPRKKFLWGVLPAVLYGILYMVNVIFIKRWPDFYNFNIGGKWYITFIVLLVVTYLLAWALSAVHNRMERHK